MPTQLERMAEALRRADAEGNQEDARKLAQAIQQMRSQPQEAAPERSMLGRATDFVKGIPGAVAGAARGPEGLPDLPEFDAPAPTTGQTIKAAGGLMASASPAEQKDIIAANYPGAAIETVEADGKQYHIVDYTDPQGKRHRGYINAPGASFRDVTQFAGQASAFLPAARVGRGLGAGARALRTAPAAAATSAGLDVAAGQAGSEQGVSLTRAGLAGLVGGGAEFLAPAAGAVWRTMRGRSQFFNNRTGQLTREGRRHAEEAGLTGEDVADLNSHAQRTFGRFLEAGIDPEIGMRVARTAEFDVPVTRGQASRSGGQLTTEERIRAGALGESSQGQLAQFGRQQQEAVEGAAGRIQQRLGGTAGREAEAAETVLTGVQRAATDLQRRIDDAYEGVRGQSFAVAPESAQRLPGMVAEALEDFDLTPDLTPAAMRSMGVVGELVDAVAKGDGARFETFRRRLGNLINSASNRTDRNAATRVKRAFDTWMDDAVDQGLFDGNPETLAMLKEARSLRAQYGRQFEALNNTDTAGKVMQNIVERAESPEQVVNYIFGQSALGRNQATSSAVRRIKEAVGEDSEVWDSIRETAWLRLTRNRRGEFVGGKVFRNNLSELQSRNKTLMDELFKPDEQRLMNRFAQAVEVTSPPRQNPSGTAASLENAIRYTLRRFGQRESFTKGNVGKGTILNFMARMRFPLAGRALGGSPAGRAINTEPPLPGSPGFVSGAAAAGSIQGGQ